MHLTKGRVTGLIHMPAQAQKVLPKPYNVRLAKRLRAVGYHTRLD